MQNVFDELIKWHGWGKIAKLESISMETPKMKSKENKDGKKSEWNIQELWDNYKRCNIACNGDTIRRKEKKKKEMFEGIMTENVPKLMSETKPQIQEAQGIISRIKTLKKFT